MDKQQNNVGDRPAPFSRMTDQSTRERSQRTDATTTQMRPAHVLQIIVLTVVVLYFGRPILIPFALAVLLTLLLTPVVHALQRRGLTRVPAVLIVMALIVSALVAAGWAVSVQVVDLATQIPAYREELRSKLAALRRPAAAEGPLQKVQGAVEEISETIKENTGTEETAPVDSSAPSADSANPITQWLNGDNEPQPVRIVEEESTTWDTLKATLSTSAGPLASAGVVVVLVIFMLIGQEDLRDRLVRLVGTGKVTLTTNTLAEMGRRISRYLLMNALINGGYGITVSLGLLIIGVDYAILWGFLAAALRFVPYAGPITASVLPIGMAVVQFDGWGYAGITAAMFIVLELITNNLIEPLLYGRSAGVSIVAILVSAIFWTWVWGPVGLILAVPMTVMLAVLGKHIPELQPLAIALGDEPPLEPHVLYYQRLLAADQEEAAELLEEHLKECPLVEIYDAIVVPALVLAEQDRTAGRLSAEQIEFIWNSTAGLIDELAPDWSQENSGESGSSESSALYVVGYSAQDQADELALSMLANLMNPTGRELQITSRATLVSELLESFVARPPNLVCLSALGPGGAIQVRYLLKRIRRQFPGMKIMVGRWGYLGEKERMTSGMKERGSNHVVTSLAEALEVVSRIRPLNASNGVEQSAAVQCVPVRS